MKIQVNNKVLEFDLPPMGRETRTDNTPYWEEFCTKNGKLGADFKRRYYFQQKIVESLKGKYKSYCDPMAGLGIIASMFEDEGVRMFLNDLDPVCANTLCDNFPDAEVWQKDYNNLHIHKDFDVTFLDFNNFTAKRYMNNEFNLKTFLNEMMVITNDCIIINDSTPFYLRYGKKSYEVVGKAIGEEIRNYHEYLAAMSDIFYEHGWSITESYGFGSMAYHKLEKRYPGKMILHTVPEGFEFNLKIL